MRVCHIFSGLLALIFLGGWLARGADNLLITEFMAVNSGTVLDEDGDAPDWIEIHNAGTNSVNLNGWFLTDKASDLTQWRFPGTNLLPNAYLLIFASGKDRRVPGAPLHTSFQLRGGGEYLALIRPDGTNVASAFAPVFPPQVDGVSYGVPVQQAATTLIATGATARVLVPTNGSLGAAWTMTVFNDTGWTSARTGVGYETDGTGPFVPAPLADSVTEFSGVQGHNNWHYGYWDKRNDPNRLYAAAEFVQFPNDGGVFGTGNFWTGTNWQWFNGDPPFTALTGPGGHPSGSNGSPTLATHWAVRRYVSELEGSITITGRVVHTSDWIRVTATGVASDSLAHLFLTGKGDGYIDDIKLVAGSVPEAGSNLIANGDFESGSLSPWTVATILSGSAVTPNAPHSGTRSLHIVSTAAGSQSNSIKQTLSPALTNGQTYTLSYWYLPATNSAPLVVQTKNRWIDTTPTYCSDGTVARIFVDGTQVFQQTALVSSSNYSLTVPVRFGSRVDFAIDAGLADRDACDDTTFAALIQTTPTTPVVVADSVADWSVSGTQGERSWSYGYYNQTTDTVVAGYQAGDFLLFPRNTGPQGTNNFWDGESWSWPNGNPPYDRIEQRVMFPNGDTNGHKHWVIRRWLSEVSGSITVEWSAQKLEDIGNGVTARLFHKGVLKDSVAISGTTVTAMNRTNVITGVQVGDPIDIALDPLGSSSKADDLGDRTVVSAVIRGTPSLSAYVATSLQTSMRNVNATAYLRIPFVVAVPAAVDFLTLRMKYDDGFITYLNGQLVASANAPMLTSWNSAATAYRADAAAGEFEEFNLTPARGLLQAGTNVLAIHGLNANAVDSDFLILPELIAQQVTLNPSAARYFALPTPGAVNGTGTTNLGPLIASAQHAPATPGDNEDLAVTARVLSTFRAIGSVRLIYRVMYGGEVNVAMLDDGMHGDGAAGDGVYGGVIPASVSTPGAMVRYYVFATDAGGSSSRFPAFDDPKDAPEYQGTVVFNPALTNPLPVLHFFVQSPALAESFEGTRGSLYFDDEFYDNVSVNLHGQTTASSFPKKSLNVDMNRGHHFRWSRDARRVHDFNLITTAPDKAHMRHVMAYEAFAAAGVPSHFAFPVRLQRNNAFFGVMHVIEDGNDDFLERLGLDPNGALYKIHLPLTSAYGGVAQKKTRQDEGNADLQALIAGCNLSGAARRNYLYDNIDIPELINFLAALQLVQNEDCCDYKNYYLYRDSDGTGEWQMIPWDLDLTFGRTFTSWVFQNGMYTGGYYDTNINWANYYYTQNRATHDFIGTFHPLPDALWTTPEIMEMFLRRWTTVHEQLLQAPGTHPLLLKFERRVDELAGQLGPDAALDLASWGTFGGTFPPLQTLAEAVQVLKTEYFARRRGWIFSTLRYAAGGPYLGPQSTNAVINFAGAEPNPASGNQAEEYIRFTNSNAYATDISGWKISGAIDYTFRAGVVIPAQGTLYVSPNVKAFRARTSGPRGGQGLFVQGNYQGQLSARGEMLQLTDKAGRLVSSFNYAGSPSPAQQYLRVTEIMYHPAPPPPGLAADAEEFEFVEVKNTGPVTINLSGVRFTEGIQFDFTGSQVSTLAPGAATVVVRNLAAFVSRYGAGLLVAGQYTGSLDNGGEALRLDDAVGEKILDFSYDNRWYPVTDGLGFSLVIVDETAQWNTWGARTSWRPSASVGGSPAQTNSVPAVTPGVLVTEVLTHSVPPALDLIEIHNPTGSIANVNDWFLTDDFGTPKKYRIHDRPPLPPGGYMIFSEADFNGAPDGFALSSKGDEVYLFAADAGGNLTGYYHGFAFGAAATNISFGRHLTSVGAEHFVAQAAPTFGGTNAGPHVGPVAITEIHYHPLDWPDGSDNSADEFIEVQNISGSSVSLFDALAPTNTWQLRGNVEFDFPGNLTLAPGALMLVANFDPADVAQLAAFRARFAVPPGVSVVGPYAGKLDNSSGSVKLSKPAAPDAGEVPYILVDEVDYADAAPWAGEADGAGATLQRRAAGQYGNDPINWTAAAPTAGRAYGGGAPPAITMQPASQMVNASSSPAFVVGADGVGPLRFQWRFNGANLSGATNAVLTLSNVLSTNAGSYQVIVCNEAGSVVSSNAILTIRYGIFISRQPTNTAVFPGAVAAFNAMATTPFSISYQWRFNGVDIFGANGSSLNLNNVQPAQAGAYQVVASDNGGSVLSAPAFLTVLGPPAIISQPQSAAVRLGHPASFSATVAGTTPLKYQWRLNGTNLPDATSSTLNLPNAWPTNGGSYTVTITNALGMATSLAAALSLLDGDADGDGMTDLWEWTHGLDPFRNDAAGDADQDGVSNLNEYLAGTDPANGNSVLRVLTVTAPGSASTMVVWNAVPGRSYRVQFKDNLGAPSWTQLSGIVTATGPTAAKLDASANISPRRFYRVVIAP